MKNAKVIKANMQRSETISRALTANAIYKKPETLYNVSLVASGKVVMRGVTLEEFTREYVKQSRGAARLYTLTPIKEVN